MDATALDHELTDEERSFFNTHGYLVVKNALSPEFNERLIDVVDRAIARERKPVH